MLISLVIALSVSASNTSAEAPAPADGADKKICKRFNDETGTRLGSKRVCKTAAEWQSDSDRLDENRFRGVKD